MCYVWCVRHDSKVVAVLCGIDLPLQFLNYCAKVYIALSCVCVKLLDGPRTMYLFTVSIVFKVWEFSHRSVSAVVRMLCMKYIRHTCCLALSGMV